MRDAATAAAMSDPTNNRWFRRQWIEVGTTPTVVTLTKPVTPVLPLDDELELLGHELLAAWRRERASREAVP